jgi:23S rRNA (cytidine1920-2'-O)/16S rRNA (cytidine1409-2'-O)-methyltransferase
MPMPAPSHNNKRTRLDQLLVDRGFVTSRAEAQRLILAGEVDLAGAGTRTLKPGQLVASDAQLSLVERPRWASRGALKLIAALDAWQIDPSGLACLDAGASTGGFTDCLLQRRAARVYAVDVGYGQLDAKLRAHPLVVVMERTHIRELKSLPEKPPLAVVDVSFISLTQVLPNVVALLEPDARIVALVKPQFEAGKDETPRDGVIRDPLLQASVIGRIAWWCVNHGLRVRDVTVSPLLGSAGNREFFLLLETPGTAA